MEPRSNRLSVKEKIGYGLGDAASNFYWQMFMNFLLFFYTDVFGISAAAAGTMFLIVRIWDTVNDPMMGLIADRTESKWGKFRPWLIWGALPIGIIGVLTFTTPGFGMSGKLIYAYITYTLMIMAYTVVNIPYSALMGVMTPDSLERTSLSSYRFVLAMAATFVVQGATLPLVKVLGGESQAAGFQRTLMVYSVAAIALFYLTFRLTKERVKPPKEQKTSLKNDLRDLSHNGPWLVMFLIGIFALTYNCIRSGAVIYYFKYYVGRESLTSAFMMAGTAAVIVGIMLTNFFAARIGKRNLYITLMAVTTVLTTLFYFVPRENIAAVFGLHIAISFFLAPTAPLIWAMYADTADYSEWKWKRRATGLVFSAASFAQKMGYTIGGALAGWLLAYFGFKANAVQTEATQNGIRLLISVIPAVGSALAAATACFYTLDEPLMKRIEADLAKRRQS
jgi:GPH family glycoside/pentoside/hexuronide:cation symporter